MIVWNCRLVSGRYGGAVQQAGSGSTLIPLSYDTTVDGAQKEIHLLAGVVFRWEPELYASAGNPSDLCVQLYGYLVKDQ